MGAIRKVTMNLPAELLDGATAATGKNATETVKIALAELQQRRALGELRKLRGKVRLNIDVADSRRDKL